MEFNLRPGTLDEFVTKEKDYEVCPYNEDDVWFDVGANIGAFAVKYSPKVKQVISFEPEEDNYNLLINNVQLNNCMNVITVNKALVENFDKTRSFYLNRKKNKGAHSMFVKNGRDEVIVQCENFDRMVDLYKPNKMKMDIEGGEWPILMQSQKLGQFDYIVFEWHRRPWKDIETNEKLHQLTTRLVEHGFKVDHRDPKSNWQIIIYAEKV